uniref:ZP domain-containing protein n=1 Tax=Amphiprion ocellaris TaxID=80972 RepID=A0A3Q1AQK4_AMPOC
MVRVRNKPVIHLICATYNFQAGYDTINSTHHLSIPGTYLGNITNIFSATSAQLLNRTAYLSNVNVPGRFAFRVDNGSRGCIFNGKWSDRQTDRSSSVSLHFLLLLWENNATNAAKQIKSFQRTVLSIFFKGAAVQRGDSFWSDSACTQKCTCTSAGLQCHNQLCSFSQICRPTSFQFSCQTVQRRTCTISGDPHYYSFDGTVFHYQGTCTYVLSEQCKNGLPYYRVEGKNEHRGSTHVSWTRLVRVHVYNETIELVKGRRGEAKVSDENYVSFICVCFSVVVTTNFVFANSWQARCGDDGLSNCALVAKYSEVCSVITDTSGPFSSCHLHADPEPFFDSCVYDLCLYTPANSMQFKESYLTVSAAESDPCEHLDCTEDEWCGEKDGVYDCFCDERHHRPNNESYGEGSSFQKTALCTMSVSRCQLFEAGFHSSALHLRDDSCNATLQDGRLVFHFDNDDQLCGTVLRVLNGTHFMYENTIRGDVDPHGGVISRQRNINLRFCCEYPLNEALSMALPSGQGEYHTKMILYQDAGYRFPFTSSQTVDIEVDEKVYVEVRTEGIDQTQISTILESCWATPVNIASNPVRWDLITEECPNAADGTVAMLQNGVSTVARFSFRMFSFTNYSSLYMHCQTHLCFLRNNNCTAVSSTMFVSVAAVRL